jgi:broad specificity phosphatase PhoE
MAQPQEVSPITGIIEEDQVFVDFGDHEGKSILEIADTLPEYYDFLIERKNVGQCTIRRSRDKIFRLYVTTTLN